MRMDLNTAFLGIEDVFYIIMVLFKLNVYSIENKKYEIEK